MMTHYVSNKVYYDKNTFVKVPGAWYMDSVLSDRVEKVNRFGQYGHNTPKWEFWSRKSDFGEIIEIWSKNAMTSVFLVWTKFGQKNAMTSVF